MKTEYEIFKTNSDKLISKIENMVGIEIIDKQDRIDFIKIKVDCLMGKDCYKILKLVEQHNQIEITKEFQKVVKKYNRIFWRNVFIIIIIVSLIFLIFG